MYDFKTADMLSDYRPHLGAYDEFVWPDGRVRDSWQKFREELIGLSPEELDLREAQLARLVTDHGITYNYYAEVESYERPWAMDLLPIILGHKEASFLEGALNQRARLLSLIRADIYGEQKLLRDGSIPPYLVMANPRFLRPMVGCESETRPLQLYSVDLSRGPDGSWWVLGDRLEAPAGLGYTLENRSLSSRVFPSLLRRLGVTGHQEFLDKLTEAQVALAPENVDEPRVVLLTPGPGHETFHEQSFLARNLGYALVEGTDLLVRDGRVFMKTISGVQPVDVIVRRVEGAWCDSLELRSESLLGVPGLVDVVRNNRVAVANNLGAGVLEVSALPAFFPGLAQKLLGEGLILPSAATWWCGQEKECQYVLEHLPTLAVRFTFGDNKSKIYRGHELSKDGLDRLKRMILTNPAQFTAHEQVARGTTPSLEQGRFKPREYVLRVFLLGGEKGWKMLPGGLARLNNKLDSTPFNMQGGGESKDVWVLHDGERKNTPASAVAVAPEKVFRRSPHALSSRVADNLFWLGRYVERTESTARSLRIILEGMMEKYHSASDEAVIPFFRLLLPEAKLAKLWNRKRGEIDVDLAGKFLTKALRDRRNPASLVCNFGNLQRVASNAKERLSVQLWQQIQRIGEFQRVAGTCRSVFDEETLRLLDETLETLSGLSGLATENMTRGEAWLFLELGRRLERADFMARLLKESIGKRTSDEEEIIRKVLTCADSGMSYRRRYLNHLHAVGVMDLLLLDKSNPRSIAFQLERIGQVFEQLPKLPKFGESSHELDRLLLTLTSRIGLVDMQELLQLKENGQTREALNEFLGKILEVNLAIGVAIENHYFAHAAPMQALVWQSGTTKPDNTSILFKENEV